jgi:hypothetical protein
MFVFVCSVFLFAPLSYLKYFGLDAWAIRFRPYFAVGFLVFSFLLAGQLWQYFYKGWQYHRKIRKYLETELSADEMMLLLRYAESGKKTQYIDPASGAANNLAGNGILYTPSPQYNVLKGCPYTLTRAAAPLVLDRDRFQEMILAKNKVNKRPKISN